MHGNKDRSGTEGRWVHRSKHFSVMHCEPRDEAELHDQCNPLSITAQQRHRQQPSERRFKEEEGCGEHHAAVPFGPPSKRDCPAHDECKDRCLDRGKCQEIARGEEGRYHVLAKRLIPDGASKNGNGSNNRCRQPAELSMDCELTTMNKLVLDDE